MRSLPILFMMCLGLQASAEEPWLCDPRQEGLVACVAGTQCRCRFDPGGSMTGRPAGFRWDCGVLRPPCDPLPPALPAPPIWMPRLYH